MTTLPWAWPITDPFRVSSPYGPRGPIEGAPGASRFHYGVDLAHPTPGMGEAFEGTTVVAPQAGEVVGVYDNTGGEGYGVQIRHPDGNVSHLMHMASLPMVRIGDQVAQAQPVGYVGSTGTSSGGHLDWRVQSSGGDWLNPESLMGEGPVLSRDVGPTPTDALLPGAVSNAMAQAPIIAEPVQEAAPMADLLGPNDTTATGGGLLSFGEINMPLLLAGASIWSNSGPSLTPNRPFAGVPGAILAGTRAQELQQDRADEQARREALAQLNLPPQMQTLVDAGYGNQVVGSLLAGPPEQSSRIRDLQFLQRNRGLLSAYQDLFGPASTNITVNAGESTPFGIGVEETIRNVWTNAYEGANQASNLMNQLDTLEALRPQAITGAFAGTRTDLANIANSLGISVEGLEASQAMRAIVNQLALSIRDPEGAFGGMPGAVSDRDIRFLLAAVPNLTQTDEGFQLSLDFMRRMARRQQEMAALANQYLDENGRIDPSFMGAAARLQQQPLFDEEARRQVEQLTGQTGAPAGTAANPAPGTGLLPAPGPSSTDVPDFSQMSAPQISGWMDANPEMLNWLYTNDPAAWAALRRRVQELEGQ